MATASKELECDYLVVGAGAAPLAFVDTLLTELPDSKVILLDKKAAPGGHWVDAYGYVHLHQPSVVYGIASDQLEGNWLKLIFGQFMLPWKHRASKNELLRYYAKFVDQKVASKQVEYFPNCVYDFEKKENVVQDGIHYFSSVDGSVSYKVKVNSKMVDGTQGECIIPNDCPLQFPVDENICVMTPNQIYDTSQEKGDKGKDMLKNKYVVLGAGKTGMDSVVYLQREMKIDPSNIAWVISNDVWSLNGAAGASPFDWPRMLVENNNEVDKAALAMEKAGKFKRIDETVLPTRFRFPIIQPDELELLKNVKNIIRRGRATAIRSNNSHVTVEFGKDHSPWEAFAPVENCVFIHATSPGPFNGKDYSEHIFENSKKINLNMLFAPPVPISTSCLAKIEAARIKGTLNTDLMRRLVLAKGEKKPEGKDFSDNDLLKTLIPKFDGGASVHKSTITQALLLVIIDNDPLEGIDWFKQNRLSMLSIPGLKSGSCDDVRLLRSKASVCGLTENEERMLEVLEEAMKPLEGM